MNIKIKLFKRLLQFASKYSSRTTFGKIVGATMRFSKTDTEPHLVTACGKTFDENC